MNVKLIVKILRFIVIILIIVFVFNTGFYALLKSSSFISIIDSYIQENNKIDNFLGDIQSIKYRYIGMKYFSWTDGCTRVAFDVVVNARNCKCIMNVVVEKRKNIDNTWSVSSIDKI